MLVRYDRQLLEMIEHIFFFAGKYVVFLVRLLRQLLQMIEHTFFVGWVYVTDK